MSIRALAISANPGDVEFACGGTLRRIVTEGGAAAICVLSNGNSEGAGATPRETAATRRQEAEAAAGVLGVDLVWFNHSDHAVANDAVTRAKVADFMRAFQPDVVLGPAPVGPNPDVRAAWPLVTAATALAIAAAARLDHDPLASAPALAQYIPGWAAGIELHELVDISSATDAKDAALASYVTLLAARQEHGGADLRAASRTVGAYFGLHAGVASAEAFRYDVTLGRWSMRRFLP